MWITPTKIDRKQRWVHGGLSVGSNIGEWAGRRLALIGWTVDQRCRLRFVANNARFLILPDAQAEHRGYRLDVAPAADPAAN